jgi:DNA-binding transcriptional LysR family regulator
VKRDHLGPLLGFLAVARERSFTKAAARLEVAPSALSHSIRALEDRLGLRLLVRTTRSVAPTAAGDRLVKGLEPHFRWIDEELIALSELRDKPSGTIRITASEYAAREILMPRLSKFLLRYPEISIEIAMDNALTNIVDERYDAGVRLGEQVAKDMVAVRLSPDMRMAVVAAPSYFMKRESPKTPHDLVKHNCINLRLPTSSSLYVWEFERGPDQLKVRVEGQLVFNSASLILEAALAGNGIAYVPEDLAHRHVTKGRLKRVLKDWCSPFPGYHLYYPSRRQSSAVLALLVEALRYRP